MPSLRNALRAEELKPIFSTANLALPPPLMTKWLADGCFSKKGTVVTEHANGDFQ
jgi:hypothetical protein